MVISSRSAEWIQRGRAAYPTLLVSDAGFANYLANVCKRLGGSPAPVIDSLHVEDLYLAFACLSRVPLAVELFEEKCGKRIRTVLAAATKSESLRAEVEQRTRAALLVGEGGAGPKLESYTGQGPLERWVAIVARRLLITSARSEQAERRGRERAALEVAMPLPTPEAAYARHKYRAEFEETLRQALTRLPERDRALLRLRFISGIEVERIATMYGVSRATATRWLAAARDTLAAEIQNLLGERLRLSRDAVVSLARLLATGLDIGLSQVLRE